MRQTVKGKVHVLLESRLSKKGEQYGNFVIEATNGELVKVFVFGKLCSRAFKDLKVKGQQIEVVGTLDEDDLSNIKVIKARNFTVAGQKRSTITKMVEEMGGAHRYNQKKREFAIKRLEQGYRLVSHEGGRQWRKLEECIKVNGVWKAQIEFTMDVMGPELVTNILREEVGGVDKAMSDARGAKMALEQLFDMALTKYLEEKSGVRDDSQGGVVVTGPIPEHQYNGAHAG